MSTVTPTSPSCDGVAIRPESGHGVRRYTAVICWLIAIPASTVLAPPVSAATANRVERRIVQLVNRERARYGLPAVRLNVHLVSAARFHSAEMLRFGYFDHSSIHPSRAWDVRVRSYLYRSVVGETLAWGTGTYATPARTVRMWMDSPPHRDVVLDARFRLVGIGRLIGRYSGTTGAMVTADFASRR